MIVVTYILFLLPSLRVLLNLSINSFPSVIIATVPCGFAAGHPGVLPLLNQKTQGSKMLPCERKKL